MSFNTHITLVATGTTGNNTSTGVRLGGSYDGLAFLFIVEAAGATPTVTWKIQGSLDPTSVSDANATWFDVAYVTDAVDTVATATRTATAVGSSVQFLANPIARQYDRYRVVTSANTNITYRAEAVPF